MTAIVPGLVALVILGLVIQLYRRFQRGGQLQQEVNSAQEQGMREINRARLLVVRLQAIDEAWVHRELQPALDGQTPLSEVLIGDVRAHLSKGHTPVHGEAKDLKQDIGDTLERIHSLRVIEGIWQDRLKTHSQTPFYRSIPRAERPKS